MTTLLSGEDVRAVLSPHVCIAAVEDAFRRLALGEVPDPAILAMHAKEGAFHVKAGLLTAERPYFAAKINANFPRNGERSGLPTIQGAVLLFDAADGRLLAVMDSMAVTALRTAAATAVAAKHLARASSETALLCGCGGQALEQLRAIVCVRELSRVCAYDVDPSKADGFALAAEKLLGICVAPVRDLRKAMIECDIVVTCTPSKRFFVTADMVKPGVFIAAVGADHEDKQEIAPELLSRAKLVTDVTEQASRIGDLHHAIVARTMTAADVHAELGEVVAGRKAGRERDDEMIVFDSTGTGLQDVAAAIAVHQGAIVNGGGMQYEFG
jgi:alanine dehydrogenase